MIRIDAQAMLRLLAAAITAILAAGAGAQSPKIHETFRVCSLKQYHDRLAALEKTVEACRVSHTTQTCDPALVGPDLNIVMSAGSRTVHLDWARAALAADRAPGADNDGRLRGVEERIAHDLNSSTANEAVDSSTIAQVHKHLDAVLARSEFRGSEDSGSIARAKQAIWSWIAHRLEALAVFSGTSPWFSTIFEGFIIAVPCVLLLIWTIRRLAMPELQGESSAPVDSNVLSAKPWQRWLTEAEDCAGQHRWRDAIHCLYWSAISRLEASGLWRADVARTPREYLTLLHRKHVFHGDLSELTHSFERIWYGNRTAREQDYQAARELLERLKPL